MLCVKYYFTIVVVRQKCTVVVSFFSFSWGGGHPKHVPFNGGGGHVNIAVLKLILFGFHSYGK